MLVEVAVKTGSKKGTFVEASPSGNLVVYLKERPHDGEANTALIKVLAKYYNAAKSCIVIKRGQKSHQKVVEIVK